MRNRTTFFPIIFASCCHCKGDYMVAVNPTDDFPVNTEGRLCHRCMKLPFAADMIAYANTLWNVAEQHAKRWQSLLRAGIAAG